MHHVEIMQSFQTINHLDDQLPNFIFLKVLFVLLVLLNLLEQIAVISVLHDNAQKGTGWNCMVHKCLVVIDHILVVLDRCQYPHLVHRVVPLFVRQPLDDPHFLQSIYQVILFSNDFINGRVTALPKLLQNLEIFDGGFVVVNKPVWDGFVYFVVDSVNGFVTVDA